MSVLKEQTVDASLSATEEMFSRAVTIAQNSCNGNVMGSEMVPHVAAVITLTAALMLVANALENQVPK